MVCLYRRLEWMQDLVAQRQYLPIRMERESEESMETRSSRPPTTIQCLLTKCQHLTLPVLRKSNTRSCPGSVESRIRMHGRLTVSGSGTYDVPCQHQCSKLGLGARRPPPAKTTLVTPVLLGACPGRLLERWVVVFVLMATTQQE